MSTPTLDDLMETSDLNSWQQHADHIRTTGTKPTWNDTPMRWNGTPSAEVGEGFFTLFGAHFETSRGFLIRRSLACLIHRKTAHPNHVACYRSIFLAAAAHPERMTLDDAMETLIGLEFFHSQRDQGIYRYAFFDEIYAILRATLPFDKALAYFDKRTSEHEGDIALFAALLAIYGIDRFTDIVPTIVGHHQAKRFYYLEPDEKAMLDALASSNHQRLVLRKAWNVTNHAHLTPHLIWRGITRNAATRR